MLPAVRWLQANTVKLIALADPAVTRKALDLIALCQDGSAASANTITRKRGIFYGCLQYGVELRRLSSHPMDSVQWIAPKSEEQVDRRAVINHAQALALLSSLSVVAPRFVAFFACMYYSALRPEEVIHLRVDDCTLPETDWGNLNLTGATPHVGVGWGDDPTAVHEDRELKHRAKKAVRDVPAPPPLVRALRWHLAEFGKSSSGRLFFPLIGSGNSVSRWSYRTAWKRARALTFTPAQQRSPLAARPYDLRHAAVSTWLNAGVPARKQPNGRDIASTSCSRCTPSASTARRP
jgi:integrase